MRSGWAGGLAATLATASVVLLVAIARRLPLDAFHYRFADHLLIAGAFAGLTLSALSDDEPASEREAPRFARFAVGVLAVLAVVGTVHLHYEAWSFYTTLVAITIGVAIAAFAISYGGDPQETEPPPRALGTSAFLALSAIAASAAIGRHFISGSFVQTWILAPLFVLAMPGLALVAAVLPVSTGWMERLFWSPVLSVGVQVVSLIWLDWLGVKASLSTFIAVALLFTLGGVGVAALSSRRRSEWLP